MAERLSELFCVNNASNCVVSDRGLTMLQHTYIII